MTKRHVCYIKRFIYKTQQSIIMAITNIHPHVGVQINAAKRKAVVAEEPKVPILFAPFVSNKLTAFFTFRNCSLNIQKLS